MKKKVWLLTVLVLLTVVFAPAVFAQDAPEIPDTEVFVVSTAELAQEQKAALPDEEDLFAGYVEQVFYGSAQAYSYRGRNGLNEQEKQIYDVMRQRIEQVAAYGGSTEIRIDPATIAGLQYSYPAGSDVLAEYLQRVDSEKLRAALTNDLPYEMYWFAHAMSTGAAHMSGTGTVTFIYYAFSVADTYSADGSDFMVSSDVARVQRAAGNANEIVERYRWVSDYEKLVAYRDEICSRVAYDYDAAENFWPTMRYNCDPWAMISVFDGDPSTNVICEGYSKAFQYLCDRSSFRNTVCYTVSGKINGGAHMWNIVTMDDGRNYLVDVTNSDAGTIGANGGYFINGSAWGAWNTGYQVGAVTFQYDSSCIELFGESILTLSSTAYVPGAGCTSHAYGAYMDNGDGTKTRRCVYCGVPETVASAVTTGITRLYGNDRYATAYAAADALKAQMNVAKFNSIIVANGENFADALAGSYLAAVKTAPILMTHPSGSNAGELASYIDANLTSDGTVYILGGPAAVPEAVETVLTGKHIKRLAGSDRFETNLLILQEAGVRAGDDILVCTGRNFPDSLSASAVGKPILLVDTGTNSLSQAQKNFLQTANAGRLYIIGGTAVIQPAMEELLQQYGTVERLAGADRYDTSVKVARKFFDDPDAAVLAYGQKFPDGLCGGPLAMSRNAPLLLAESTGQTAAGAYMNEHGICDGYVLGGPTLIDDRTVMLASGGR